MKETNYISNRTVGFIDIFPFRTILNNFGLEKVGDTFSSAVAIAHENYKWDSSVDRRMQPCIKHIFSDSIIVYSLDDSEYGCLTVIKYIHRIFQTLLGHQIPARAAVVFGESYINPDKNIHIGNSSFTRAYEIERAQNWIGGVIDTSINEKQFPNLFLKDTLPEIIRYPFIPFKNEPEFQQLGKENITYAINWLHHLSDKPVDPLDVISHFPKMFGEEINFKHSETVKFIEYVHVLINRQNSTVEKNL